MVTLFECSKSLDLDLYRIYVADVYSIDSYYLLLATIRPPKCYIQFKL
jgi:hypothetical protein